MTPKKPTQVPEGDLSDAVGKHDESFTNDERTKHVDEADEKNEKDD